ncbi:tetratricopeptide repeat protein [Armatimonas sp.]|uniref:tetratricopeptide repeat protein n=1 Tax=Armatimonas sp. TaxID=1872638 RepID=UPI0037538C9F
MNRFSFVFPITAALTVGSPVFISTPAHAQSEDELNNLAMAALKAERWEELERLNTKLIAIDSQWFPYFTNRAIARLNRNHFTESIADSTRAEALVLLKKGTAREHAIQVTHRCLCYILQGDPIRAVIESTMACNIDDTHANAWKARAEAFYAVGDYDKAVYYLGEAQKRDKSIKRTFSQAEAKQNARKHTSIDVNADTSADEALGAKALKEKRYADAIAPYTRVIEKCPTAVGSWLYRGDAHYDLKNYDKAIADWTTAFCIFHTTEASPETLSDVLVNRANAYRLSRPALLDEAQLDCELALKFQPGDKRAQTVLAKIKETREESDPEALQKFARDVLIVADSKTSPDDLAKAIKNLDKITALDPSDANAWWWRAKAELVDIPGKHPANKDAALTFFDKAVAADPEMTYAYYARAMLRLELIQDKHLDKASATAQIVRDLDKAIALAAADPSDFIRNADAYFERGKLRVSKVEAIADFTKALDENSRDSEYLTARAQAYETQKDWRSALKDWRTLLIDHPTAATFAHAADLLVELKDFEGSLADYGKAIALEPANSDYLIGRARALRLAGKKLLALADYQKASALNKAVPKIKPDLSNVSEIEKARVSSLNQTPGGK